MLKLRIFGAKCAATVATAAALGSNTAASLFSKGSNTAASLNGTLSWLFSRLKTPFYSRVCRIGSNTFPNSSQEINALREESDISPVEAHFPNSYELGDEFDEDDFDGYLSEEEWLELMDDEEEEITSWEQRAVDEAIDEEEPGQYPSGGQI